MPAPELGVQFIEPAFTFSSQGSNPVFVTLLFYFIGCTFPDQESKPSLLLWKPRVLTAGPPRRSHHPLSTDVRFAEIKSDQGAQTRASISGSPGGDSARGPWVPPLCVLSLTVSKSPPLGLPSHILSDVQARTEGGCELFRGAGGILLYR